MRRIRGLDLQAKITLVLLAVLLPTFVVVTVVENQLTQPILADEMKQIGITSGKTLAAEISSRRLLSLPNPTPVIESRLQEFIYGQPNIIRVDVFARDPLTGVGKLIGSNIEEEPGVPPPTMPLVENALAEIKTDEQGMRFWEISVPIEQRVREGRGAKRVVGTVHLQVSMKFIQHTVNTLWKITVVAACLSVVMLFLALTYFLRKTIANDRLLRRAEDQNLQLTAQLHELERQLMNTEKLAVMGQLTASFAHEIGTPLNAIGGHLQLLKEDVTKEKGYSIERFDVINGQLSKIEQIVKNFLQSTVKPSSQTQLVDLNRLMDQTLSIVRPRTEALGVEVRRKFDRSMGPLRVVPLDFEQIFMNLFNNSLDSLKVKSMERERGRGLLEVTSRVEQVDGNESVVLSVYDTGEGIRKSDMANVLKPFFTTKRPGEGTGLGLTICQQLIRKYGGTLEIDSKEGTWTRVTLKVPYQVS